MKIFEIEDRAVYYFKPPYDRLLSELLENSRCENQLAVLDMSNFTENYISDYLKKCKGQGKDVYILHVDIMTTFADLLDQFVGLDTDISDAKYMIRGAVKAHDSDWSFVSTDTDPADNITCEGATILDLNTVMKHLKTEFLKWNGSEFNRKFFAQSPTVEYERREALCNTFQAECFKKSMHTIDWITG